LVRFGFLGQKQVQTGLARFFPILAPFFKFGSVFPVWLGFARFVSSLARFFFGLGSVRFFRFFAYKTETEPADFFKILIGLIDFFLFNFSSYFFLIFSV
jgi:hypothetical protein